MKDSCKYILLFVFLLLIFVGFLIIKPFLTPILTSLIVAYLFYPLYKQIRKRIKNEVASSILASVIIILLITIPGFLILQKLTKETYVSYFMVKRSILGETELGDKLVQACEGKDSPVCAVIGQVKIFLNDPQIQFYLQDATRKITDYITKGISNFIFTIPRRILELFIIFFMIYYLFKDGEEIVDKFKTVIPIKRKYQNQLFLKIKEVSYAIVFGSFVVAIIQGALGAFGFFIFKVNSPIIWGLVMAFFAFLPFFVGTAIVWVPIGVLLLINGYMNSNPDMIWRGLGILIYGAFVISTVDNLIRPKIIGETGHIHPIVVLLGFLGGLALFGFIGIVVGPLILAILLNFSKIYIKENVK